MTCQIVAEPTLLFKAGEQLKSLFYSKFYLAYLALFTVLFYCTNTPVLGLSFFALLACVTLLLYRDLTPFMPLHLFVVLIFRDFSAFDNLWVFLIFVPVVICLIAHFFIYPIKKVFIGKLFFPIIFVSIALLLGGLFSPYYKDFARGLITTLTVGPLILFAYFLFSQYVSPLKDFNLKQYFFFALCMIALAACLELFFQVFFQVNLHPTQMHTLGWGSWNSVGAILLFAIPACWYMMLYSRHGHAYLLLLIFFYYSMYLTQSEGAAGTAFAMTPIILLTAIFKGRLKENKYRILKVATILFFTFIVATLFAFAIIGELPRYIELFLLELGNDSSRTKLYIEAMELFKKFPIFGVGSGYTNPDSFLSEQLFSLTTYNFHSTIIHVMATMGIVGIIAYVVYFVARFKILCHNSSPFNIFAFLAFIMFEIYASVDTGEFCVIPLLFCITALFVVTEKNNSIPEKEPLELKLHTFEKKF